MRVKIINNCRDCVLASNDNETGFSCNISDIPDWDITKLGETNAPIRCPLRESEIIVILKSEE